VKAWAATNCFQLNLSKTKEIVFKQPRVQYFHMPAPVVDIEQLDCCKLLGVIFQSNFKMDLHIQFILSQCTQRLYLLKLFCIIRVCPMLNYQLLLMLLLLHVFCMPSLHGEGSCLSNLSIELMFLTTYAAFWLSPVSYHCSRTYE